MILCNSTNFFSILSEVMAIFMTMGVNLHCDRNFYNGENQAITRSLNRIFKLFKIISHFVSAMSKVRRFFRIYIELSQEIIV
jgi:hypothetical protein